MLCGAIMKNTKSRETDQRIVQLKITLLRTKPIVWRRIQVPASATFQDLAGIINTAMGFFSYHLYLFTVADEWVGNKEFDQGEEWISDALVHLGAVADQGIMQFSYEYDFGDSWKHKILIEKVLQADPSQKYPICIAGKNACPPEDCGGVWGFESLKEIMANKKHPEYKEMLEWLGEPYDPLAFDREQINRRLIQRY
jgi:hypothetical protein